MSPIALKELVIGSSEFEDYIFCLRSGFISANKALGIKSPLFDQLTSLRQMIEDRRPKPALTFGTVASGHPNHNAKVSPHDLWEPDAALTQWLEQSKVPRVCNNQNAGPLF